MTVSNVSFAPLFVSDRLSHCTINTVTRDDVSDLTNLIEKYRFPYYRDGVSNDKAWMEKRVVTWLKRCDQGVPFTGFAVRDLTNQLCGFFVLGFDEDPKKLQIAFAYTPIALEQGVGEEVLDWALHRYIPILHTRSYSVGADHGERTPLCKLAIVAQEHPDFEACQWLVKQGFELKGTKVIPEYRGLCNDGRRNIYEIPVARLLGPGACRQ